MSDKIQGYFFGLSFAEKNHDQPVGLAGFAIPDLGIVFRSRWAGTLYQCQYAGLLSLLRFIEMNKESLAQFEFEILSDSTLVINQIAHRLLLTSELAPYYRAAIDYKNKVNYRVSWVPHDENVAIAGWGNIPPLNPDLPLNLGLDFHVGQGE
jgi:hypothetical protein